MELDEDRFNLFIGNIKRQTGPHLILSEERLKELVKNADYPEQVTFTPRGGRTVTY